MVVVGAQRVGTDVESGDGVRRRVVQRGVGARGSRARCQKRAVSGETGGVRGEVELAGGASRAWRVADAGGERRHGEKQRGERWSEGRLVNKAKFKNFLL